jgi:hypothetical protein
LSHALEKSDGWDKMPAEKILSVKEQIEEDFNSLDKKRLENFFDKFQEDRRTSSFIQYYNHTVLDRKKINFGEFKIQWGIQGMTREFYSYFDENSERLKQEIVEKRNIREFFEKYCCKIREEATFCTKLFHTFLPNEFPPIDNAIRRKFRLNEKLIDAVLIIKEGYKSFIKNNPKSITGVRSILSKPKFGYLRADELSDIRILDMYYWFNENRI